MCSYCDFCKLLYNKDFVKKYLDALEKEISNNYKGEILDTIYIGGGTPSSLSIVELNKLFSIIKIFKLSKEYEFTFEDIKNQKLESLREYDASKSVNQFSIDNVFGWLNKSDRVGLMNSINIEKEAGRSETSIWIGDTKFVLSIERAIDILQQLELYALACFDTTQRHTKAIQQLETKEEIEAYNYYVGYPGNLSFAG
ncbi:MAG: hypothetical protein BHW07_04040 [Clostridium sp. CAG_433_25_7]|nr:MAG: hypothetical protein BHW07_04040 [Clostridium sp. CAG_433_25_7]